MRVAVHLVDRRVAEETVGEAGGVAHQLAHGGRVVGIGENHLAVGVDALVDLEVGELGDEFGDGVGGEPLALLVEDHHGDPGDRLGHGVVAENHVLGHGRRAGQVALAVGAVVDDLAVAGEDGDDAGDLLLVDGLLHKGVETLQALGGKAERLGRADCELGWGLGWLLRGRRREAKGEHNGCQYRQADHSKSIHGHEVSSQQAAETCRSACNVLYIKRSCRLGQ